jgi:hypothetical protein
MIIRKTNLVFLEELPFCTYILCPAFLPWLETLLEALYWNSSETP